MTKFDRFFARMQKLGVRDQNRLAEILSLSPQAIHDAKRRGVVPGSWAFVVRDLYGIPLEITMETSESEELRLIRECMKDISKIKKRLTVLEKTK